MSKDHPLSEQGTSEARPMAGASSKENAPGSSRPQAPTGHSSAGTGHEIPAFSPSKEGSRVNRRSFLTLLAQGSVAAAITAVVVQTIRFLGFQPPDSESSVVPLGGPDNYESEAPVYVAEARVYIGRDGNGLYALDAVCPHLGCLVEPNEEGGYMCPCHDSLFDDEGRALSGPATQPLQHLYLWYDGDQGQLLVDRSEPVDPAVRLII